MCVCNKIVIFLSSIICMINYIFVASNPDERPSSTICTFKPIAYTKSSLSCHIYSTTIKNPLFLKMAQEQQKQIILKHVC